MPGKFVRDLLLFLYLCAIVSFVWAALNHEGKKEILKEGFKTFGIFTISAVIVSVAIYFFT